jgi:hypothetical protein
MKHEIHLILSKINKKEFKKYLLEVYLFFKCS